MIDFSGEPAFVHRAFMLDVSRDRVPTIDTLDWLLGVLGDLRFTELQLYVEHTFAYAGHDVVWADASPLTVQDMTRLRARGAEVGVELVANVNGFGHMERWLRHDAYRHRAECPEIPAELAGFLSRPTCLAPTADNADFALGLAREMLEAVGSNRIMIGGDEPFELGLGVSASDAAERGLDVVYREHLGRIVEPLVADGHEVLFWGDQFRRDPASVDWIPDGARCVIWHYEAPAEEPGLLGQLPSDLRARLGLPDDAHRGFASHARLVADAGAPFWVAPGTSTWNTLLGRRDNAAANIADAASVGASEGAEGFLLTDWGDNGHWQPLVLSLPALVRAAEAAWTGRTPTVQVGPVIDELLGAPHGTGAVLDELGTIADDLGVRTFNGTAVFDAAIDGAGRFGDPAPLADPAPAHAAIVRLDGHAAHLDRLRHDASGRARLAIDEVRAVTGAARLGLQRLAGETIPSADRDAVLAEQRSAWLTTSRPGGLDDSLARLR